MIGFFDLGERESFQVSNGQLQELLKQHKLDIDSLHTQIEALENDKVKLSKTISELNEKLFISDTTIDSLQQQIYQMNQSESLPRARAQHESILSTMRQKHENEILTLNEKLDDIKQALAWKVSFVLECNVKASSRKLLNVGFLAILISS